MSAEERYDFPEILPLNPVPAGTNLLVSGPPMGATGPLGLTLAIGDPDGEDAAILISTDTAPDRLFSQCRDRVPGLSPERLGIVDCNGNTSETAVEAGVRVETVSKPNDLTGIGIDFSQLYERFHSEGVRGVRVGLFDVSTLLLYTDLRPVFRFLHVATGRIQQAGGIGVFRLHPGSHDAQTIDTITQLFDAQVDVRETEQDDGTAQPQLRVRGLTGQPSGWTDFDI